MTIACDERWSFVGNKDDKQWLWLALDRDTREMVGGAIGARNEATARQLWESLPPVYRQCAVCSTDFREAYACVLPEKRHRPVGKESGQTSHIERVNNTLRQRISRLVRKPLSFSKKRENHSGAIWYFIHHYNASLAYYDTTSVGRLPNKNQLPATGATIAAAGESANAAADRTTFARYQSRRPASTLAAQRADMARFAAYLSAVGLYVDAADPRQTVLPHGMA